MSVNVKLAKTQYLHKASGRPDITEIIDPRAVKLGISDVLTKLCQLAVRSGTCEAAAVVFVDKNRPVVISQCGFDPDAAGFDWLAALHRATPRSKAREDAMKIVLMTIDAATDGPVPYFAFGRRTEARGGADSLKPGIPLVWAQVARSASDLLALSISIEGVKLTAPDIISLMTNRGRPFELHESAKQFDFGEKHADPTHKFLTNTLIHKVNIKSRNKMSFLTIRSWRKSIKDEQVSAIKAIKAAPPAEFVHLIGGEIEQAVDSFLGTNVFRAIVPIPCGHSRNRSCLSRKIAENLSLRIGIPVVEALALAPQKGSSHPKANLTRPPMSLRAPVEGPVLLVDDIATSGRHIEEAYSLLKIHSPCVQAVAWLCGEISG